MAPSNKLIRILTKDWVTAPIRGPFVHYEGSAGGGGGLFAPVGRQAISRSV